MTENQNANSNSINNNLINNKIPKKKIKIIRTEQVSDKKVVMVNSILDFKDFLKKNFNDSKKGWIALGIFTLYILRKKRPFIYNIKNNYEITKSLIEKNKTIKVNPVKNPEEILTINGTTLRNTSSFRFSYGYGYRNINNLFSNISSMIKNISLIFLKNNKYRNEKNKINDNNQLEVIKGIEVKLAGIKDMTDEGKSIAEKLIYHKSSKIKLQFNHILYMDTPEIYCWIYIKNKNFSRKEINLNIFLTQQGLANVNKIKLNDIEEERIYYNYSDLIDAERLSKEKGLGIWSRTRSNVIRESSVKNERFFSFFERFATNINLKKWQKSILNK